MVTAVPSQGGETDSAELFVGPRAAPDRYRLLRVAGVGGEGEVWAAEQRLTDTVTVPVAVKILSLVCPESAGRSRRRWEDQVARVRLLRRPGIARVFESFEGARPHEAGNGGDGDDAFYVILEWIAGPSLQAWTADQPDLSACLDMAIEALLPVAEALDYMHSGEDTGRLPVVHGDVKPANILMGPQGATLVDFGLVRAVDGAPPSAVGGTPGYLAPEVMDGGRYSPASDRYAFGGVVYFLITGRHPSVQHDPRRMRAELVESGFASDHPGLVDHLLRMLAIDANKRPAALTPWLSAFGAATTAPSPPAPVRHRRPGRTALALVGLAVLAVVAMLSASLLGRRASTPPGLTESAAGASLPSDSPVRGDIVLEGESGTGDGNVMPRSAASNARTLWLHDGEQARLTLTVETAAVYGLAMTYSNDNDDALPSEEVSVEVVGVHRTEVTAPDTGSGGAGWNVFQVTTLGEIPLQVGSYEVVVGVRGGDGYGVEIDRLRLSKG